MFDWAQKAKDRLARVEADVASLMNSAADPYAAARARERTAADEREAAHWSRVAVAVAKRTGKAVGLDTATRMLLEPARQRVYRLRFMAPSGAGPRVAEEREIRAPSAGAAMEAIAVAEWPPRTTYAILVDLDGAVIAEHSRPSGRRPGRRPDPRPRPAEGTRGRG